jgi:hypothetical protein
MYPLVYSAKVFCLNPVHKYIVSNILASFPLLNYSPSVLVVLLVVMLVVVLLSCCCHCIHLLCCRVANTAPAATIGTPPPPPPPLVSEEDDACYTNADSSPVQVVCWALESHALLDQPILAGRAGGKGGNDDGGTSGGGTRLVWYSPPSPEAARRQQGWQASEGRGNKEGNCNDNKGGKQ